MLLLLLLFGFPTILYHCIFSLTILCLYVYYKIYHNYKQAHQAATSPKITSKMMIMSNERKLSSPSFAYHATLVIILTTTLSTTTLVLCTEQDANILKPFASLAKSIISTTTLGTPTPIEFGASSFVRDLLSLSIRTRFPVSIPKGFTNKTQEFFNRVMEKVADIDVKLVPRKTLSILKNDLDAIVDAIVDEVRQSPDGLYTDYLKTQVNGVSLEEAAVAVGTQLKAYGTDLRYYRDIAGAVLGIPLMPTLASGVVDAGKMAMSPISTVTSLPGNIYDTGSRLPGAAYGTVSHLGNSAFQQVDNIRGYIPGVRNLPSPMSYFGGGSQTQTPSQMAAAA